MYIHSAAKFRNILLALFAGCAAMLSQGAAAQDYPSKSVRVVVLFPPAGAVDPFIGTYLAGSRKVDAQQMHDLEMLENFKGPAPGSKARLEALLAKKNGSSSAPE